jgi:hypothetical protein
MNVPNGNKFTSPQELLDDLIQRVGVKEDETITQEELLDRLDRDLTGPITVYNVEGWYAFHGEGNPFTGAFQIDANGKFAGEIKDPASVIARHIVCGRQIDIKTYQTLRFVKIPTGGLMNIYYIYTKIDGKKEIEGKYTGSWSFGNEGIPFKIDRCEFETEKTNKSEITLKLVK